MKTKVKYLDGLRGIAAIVVVISHFLQVFYPSVYSGDIKTLHTKNSLELILYKTPLNLLVNSNFSVCIFFVLSGFVLSLKFFKYKERKIILSGASRRYLRLAIPVFITLLIAYIFMNLNLFYIKDIYAISKTTIMNRYKVNYSLMAIIKQSFYSIMFTNFSSSYNASLWTIKYEFIGSLMIFASLFIFSFVKKIKVRFIIYFILIMFTINQYYLAFILGVLLSDLVSNCCILERIHNKVIYVIIIPVSLFLGSYPYCNTDNTIYNILNLRIIPISYFTFYHIIGATLLLLGILKANKLQAFFSTRVIRFLGKISFSLYLVHFLIINSLSCFLFKNLIGIFSYRNTFVITIVVSLVVMIIISYVLYLYVDLNAISISHSVYRKLTNTFSSTLKRLNRICGPANIPDKTHSKELKGYRQEK